MRLYTIGFTKTTAENFFGRIKNSGSKEIIDIRLNNVSQLAGFAKRDDLKYFVKAICGIGYRHIPELAPTQDLLDKYKKGGGDWAEYELAFIDLMQVRQIENMDRSMFESGCLLCSEDKPHHCHRRLVAEYLERHWGDIEIIHL
ncbi:MAG: DUF488 family protein [Rectinemataceae bacterium]